MAVMNHHSLLLPMCFAKRVLTTVQPKHIGNYLYRTFII